MLIFYILSIVYMLLKLQRFGSNFYFRLQEKAGHKSYLLDPLVELM